MVFLELWVICACGGGLLGNPRVQLSPVYPAFSVPWENINLPQTVFGWRLLRILEDDSFYLRYKQLNTKLHCLHSASPPCFPVGLLILHYALRTFNCQLPDVCIRAFKKPTAIIPWKNYKYILHLQESVYDRHMNYISFQTWNVHLCHCFWHNLIVLWKD